jgi:uncharacterized protein (TIGR02266 family)
MDKTQNKRIFERVVINSDRIYDLSEGGVYIKTKEPKRLGALVGVEMKLFEREDPVCAKGKIIRIIYERGGLKRFPPGMAIQFTSIDEKEREKIRLYISSRKSGRI